MKKFKILSAILALILVFSVMPATFASAAESKIFDVIGLDLNLKEGQKITRYDLAKMAISLGGLELEKTGSAKFADVPEKYWAFPEVNTVTMYGYMDGNFDGTFMPESEASIADAAQVLMNLLGYGSFGKQADWKASNYLAKANSIGLLKGVVASGKLDVESLKIMILNMLAENVVTIGSIGNEGATYVVDNEVTYLQSRYGYFFKEGVMKAAGKSAITGSSPVSAGKVKVGSRAYNAQGVDYSDFLGYEVRVIVDKDEDNANLLYMEKISSDEDNELYLRADKIEDYSAYRLTYRDESDKIEYASISGTSQVFVNGQKTAFDERLMQPLSGSVRLLDTDDDRIYDMVYITYELYYEVSGAFKDEYVSDAITGATLNIDKVEFSVYENGKITDISSVKNENVVVVMPGAIAFDANDFPYADNSTLTRASIETGIKKVEGLVTAKSAYGCTIGDATYNFSGYFRALVSNGYVGMPELNKDAILYLNSENEIVYAKLDAQAIAANRKYKYAYLIRAAESRGGGEKLVVRMFTQDAEFISTETPNKFKFNGRNADVNDVVSNEVLFPGGVFKNQLIAYEIDEETGLLTSIMSAVDYTEETDYAGYDLVNFSLEYKNSSALYRNNFIHLYTSNSDTILFDIPSDLGLEQKYAVKTGSGVFTWNTNYNVALYDADDAYDVGVALIDRTTTGGSSLDARRDLSINHFQRGIVTFVVEDKNIVLNEAGEEVYELTGKSHNGGNIETLSLVATDNELPDTDKSSFGHIYSEYEGVKWYQLTTGDVIHFNLDSNGYVERFRLVFRQADMKDGSDNIKYKVSGAPTSSTFVVAGAVEKALANGTILFRTSENSSASTLKKSPSSNNTMIFICENGKVRKGTASELRPNEAALFVSESGILYEMVVYRD